MLNARDIDLITDISGLSGECNSISEFADAVLDPMTQLFGSRSSLFYTYTTDHQRPVLSDCFAQNVDLNYCGLYQQNYHRYDPCYRLFEGRLQNSAHASVSTDEAIDQEYSYINSAYYADFLKPQNIHNSLIFNVADQHQLYGLFGFHRGPGKEDYTPGDHLKARLLANQFSTALRLINLKDQQAHERQLLSSVMDRAAISGFLTIDQKENLQAASAKLDHQIALLAGKSQEDYWPMIKAVMPEEAQVFVDQFLNNALDRYYDVELDIPEHTSQILPALHLKKQKDHDHLSVFFINEPVNKDISESKLDFFNLTNRQKDVVYLINLGLTNLEIAHRMGISPKTLESHLTHIYQKTNCHNKPGLLHLLRP